MALWLKIEKKEKWLERKEVEGNKGERRKNERERSSKLVVVVVEPVKELEIKLSCGWWKRKILSKRKRNRRWWLYRKYREKGGERRGDWDSGSVRKKKGMENELLCRDGGGEDGNKKKYIGETRKIIRRQSSK